MTGEELLAEWDAALWPLTAEERASAWQHLAGWLIGTAADRPDEVRRGFIAAVAFAQAKHGGQQ